MAEEESTYSDSYIKLKEFLTSYLSTAEKASEDGSAAEQYMHDFLALRELTMRIRADKSFSCDAGLLPCNRKKNRYKDILPFDSNRVVLDKVECFEDSDYINASFISGPGGSRRYIATQGPLHDTEWDFWRMIIQYKVIAIVMVCNEKENGKVKCSGYWPKTTNEPKGFADLDVNLISEELTEFGFTRREFCITRETTGEKHHVTQFHLEHWPDHGITEIPNVLEMIAQMRSLHRDSSGTPIVVHCSAGCGRTGCIIAIDYMLSQLTSGELSDDFRVYDVIEILRHQRTSMVQSPDQYKMVHFAILELFKRQLEMMAKHEYENTGQLGPEPDVDEMYECVEPGARTRSVTSNNSHVSSLAEELALSSIYGHSPPKPPQRSGTRAEELPVYSQAKPLQHANTDTPAEELSVIPIYSQPKPAQHANAGSKPQPAPRSPKSPGRTASGGATGFANHSYAPMKSPARRINSTPYAEIPPDDVAPPKPPAPARPVTATDKFEYSYVDVPSPANTRAISPANTRTHAKQRTMESSAASGEARGREHGRHLDLGHKMLNMFSKKKDGDSLDAMTKTTPERPDIEQVQSEHENISFPHRTSAKPRGPRRAPWQEHVYS